MKQVDHLLIAQYWLSAEGRQRFPENKASDLGEPCCFGCGYYAESWADWSKLERAHLQPRSLGGADTVTNIVLLCHRCHESAPDYQEPDAMLQWLSRQPMEMMRSFNAIMRELEQLGVSVDAVRAFALSDRQTFLTLFEQASSRAGQHLGAGLKPSTIALMLQDLLQLK